MKLNCLQVESIYCMTPEELQDKLNEVLANLGKRVESVNYIVPLLEGYGANVTYWSQDVPAAIEVKCEEIAAATPDSKEPLFVAVITEGQRAWTYNALSHMVRMCEKNAENARMTGNASKYNTEIKERDIYVSIMNRFEPDIEEELIE